MNDSTPHQFTNDFEIEADFRGETLRYIEGGQRTQMMWTWSNGYTVYSDTLESWRNADGSSSPLSESDRKTVLDRVVKYALDVQRVKMKVE
jgi:multidrug resistance efflux pump